MDGPDVELEAGVAREQALAEDALEGLKLHVDALRVVLQVRDRFEGLFAAAVSAAEGPHALRVGDQVVLEVLLLLEGLVTALEGALELALVALEVPVQLALADELAIQADGTLEF